MALESQKELGRQEAEAWFNLEDTFPASVEEFDSLTANVQELGGPGRPGRNASLRCRSDVAWRTMC